MAVALLNIFINVLVFLCVECPTCILYGLDSLGLSVRCDCNLVCSRVSRMSCVNAQTEIPKRKHTSVQHPPAY